jgi:hypothetical protein
MSGTAARRARRSETKSLQINIRVSPSQKKRIPFYRGEPRNGRWFGQMSLTILIHSWIRTGNPKTDQAVTSFPADGAKMPVSPMARYA